MKIKIRQIRNNNGDWIVVKPNDKPIFRNIGWIEMEEFDAEKCWDLCNWGCWTDKKPENLHSPLRYCNSDVAFRNPETGEWWAADHVGWKTGKEALCSVRR